VDGEWLKIFSAILPKMKVLVILAMSPLLATMGMDVNIECFHIAIEQDCW